MEFKQGDKVVFQGEEKAEVQFGPVTSAADKESYLVKWLEGTMTGLSSIVWAEDLVSVPKFRVGDRVSFKFSPAGTSFELVAGPFSDEDESFYVLKDQEGNHETSFEKYMVPVVE